jgi:hypothetical protein
MAAGADEQYLPREPAPAAGEWGQRQPAAGVEMRLLDQAEGAPGAGVMAVGGQPERLVAKPATLELGLEPRLKAGPVAGDAWILLVDPEQKPAAVAGAAQLAKDERRETDPTGFVERTERVPAEDVRDFHDQFRPRLRNRHETLAAIVLGEEVNG